MSNKAKFLLIVTFIIVSSFVNVSCKREDFDKSKAQSQDSNQSKEDIDRDEKKTDSQDSLDKEDTNENPRNSTSEKASKEPESSHNYINKERMTLESRINTPTGYKRIETEPDSFLSFIRSLEPKEDGSPILLYNGNKKKNQKAQVAVFKFDVGERDLQQCADSIFRLYSEYYFAIGEYENIRFHLTNGFLLDYENWREGKRIKVEGNNVSWVNSSTYDDSYENFRKYLTNVMAYAGTLSMDQESSIIDVEDLKVGDILLKAGSPGHVVLVIDEAENEHGDSCHLLAQGYMPAQDFHVLKNPRRGDCPWYFKEDLTGEILTPEYGFDESHIKRWNRGFN